ncbi:MAG: GMC oxidoreductase [Xenococcaceae cyanobacterium]
MPFQNNYVNLVAEKSQAHTRLIRDYDGTNKDFDFIIIGSGMGGGILADDLADRLENKRILVLDAGSFIYPTHVYNICRFPNFKVARHFGVDNFNRAESESNYIGENPQLAFGGRSIFWSGLIPDVQDWELEFFPDSVRNELKTKYLKLAGEKMNQSISLGKKAKDLVEYFRSTDLNNDFVIEETPRALHQPYLDSEGTPSDRFYTEPTGVFNTAELLINQAGLTPGNKQDNSGLFIKLNSFVEAIKDTPLGWHEVIVTDTITGEQSIFYAPKVIIAAGSIESPKLINRSAIYQNMTNSIKQLVGFGLTDHPVTGESQVRVSGLGGIALSREDHAKIIFYSRGNRDRDGHVTFPFNVEMNINHEYWHLRNNDPSDEEPVDNSIKTRVDIKFSFANCLDNENGILSRFDDGYVPEIRFKRFSLLNDLLDSRFPALAGWRKSEQDFFNLLNGTRDRIFNEFDGLERVEDNYDYGRGNNKQLPFGWGTVHHACGTLRMPWKSNRNSNFNLDSVVDENLKVKGSAGLYVCDMSVMPISTAANPVRTLGGLALRLSQHLG